LFGLRAFLNQIFFLEAVTCQIDPFLKALVRWATGSGPNVILMQTIFAKYAQLNDLQLFKQKCLGKAAYLPVQIW
jgi:hypothetical protein